MACATYCGDTTWTYSCSNCATSCSQDCGSCGLGCGDCTGGCDTSCSGSCRGCRGCSASCMNDCSSGCDGGCKNTCKNTCSNTCANTCTDACNNGCTAGARTTDFNSLTFMTADIIEFSDINRLETMIANELTRRGLSRNNSIVETAGSIILAKTMQDANANLTRMGKNPFSAPSSAQVIARQLAEQYSNLVKELYKICIPAK